MINLLLNAVGSRFGRLAAGLALGLTVSPNGAQAAPSYSAAALANGPAGFWQLSETGDPSTGTLSAADSSGNGLHGTYGISSYNGYYNVLSPQPPQYQGFAVNQGALQTTPGDINSVVTLPALNLSSTVVDTTIAMWINPYQQPPADGGLFFDRSGGASTAGFGFGGQDTTLGLTRLGYNWNDSNSTWSWNSGLYPPIGSWSFVALVVQSNRATVYLYYIDPNTSEPVLASAVNNVNHSPVTWSGPGPRWIGGDQNNVNRTFPGQISGAVIYNKALTADELLGMFAGGLGVNGFAPSVTAHPKNQYALAGSTISLRATVGGSGPLSYQWQLNGVNVNTLPNSANYVGANSNVLTIANISASETGTYRLVVTNLQGTAISSNATVTIQAPALVGKWFTNGTLEDLSGFSPAGTHDATPIGSFDYSFSSDVPNGKSGQSIALANGTGISIQNSSTFDVNYVDTFDERINNAFSVAVWAKGWPTAWSPFVSKYGETTPNPSGGWQLRQNGQNNQNPLFTVRGAAGSVALGTAPFNNPEDLAAAGLNLGDDTNNWHYYVGTYDASTGVRSLYVDGILRAQITNGVLYSLSPAAFLCIGARDSGNGNYGSYFNGLIYDARIYNYALSPSDVLGEYGVVPPTVAVQPPASVAVLPGRFVTLSTTASGTPTLGYRWQRNGTDVSLLPNSTNYIGANSNVLTILNVSANETGTYRLIVTNLYGTAISSDSVVTLAEAKLVGHWFKTATLADISGFRPAGTHDGMAIGAGDVTFVDDVPPGFTGQSVRFANSSGVSIQNSSTVEANYTNTFDSVIRNYMTVSFWAKGWPGQWNPFVAKYGETTPNPSGGWQIRRQNDADNVAWTIRGAGGTVVVGQAVFGNAEDTATTGLTLSSQAGVWHHYVGTYNAATGVRTLFVDGVVRAYATNNGLYALAPDAYLTVGARDTGSGNYGNFFNGQIYDLQIYNYDLSTNEVLAMIPDPVIVANPPATRTAYEGTTMQLTVSARTLATPVTYQWQFNGNDLSNGNLSGAVVSGANSNVLTIANVTSGVAGVYRLVVTSPAGSVISSNSTVTVLPIANPPGANLVGAWITGDATLADTSGYRPAGTHDGYGVTGAGIPATGYAFTNDVPPGKTGHSLTFIGNTAIAITNSSTLDGGYMDTFDAGLTSMTVMTWAKGWPGGGWDPFVSKWGESGLGWQLRRNGGSNPTWTVRGTGGVEDMWAGDLSMGNDGQWHHYAGTFTFDGVTGVRNLYVDGVLRATQAEVASYVGSDMSHLTIGGRDNGGNNFGNYFTGGRIYGVRIYNVALSEAQINSFRLSPVTPMFTAPPALHGNKFVISWSGGTLLQSTNVAGPWVPTGATSPFTNDVTTAPQMFYKLSTP